MQMCILAIDFGRKRIGLALTRSGSLVVTLDPIKLTTTDALFEQLDDLITHERVERVVIGDGILQPSTRRWLAVIKKGLSVPVTLVDEKSSTDEAQQRLGTTQHHADSAAAAIILERYLLDLLQ